MYTPMLIAEALAAAVSAVVTFSTTTRSPVLVRREPGYAIHTGITFPAHDDPDDGPGPRFAYNLPPCDAIVLVIDDACDTRQLHAPDGLVAQLLALASDVLLVTIPSYRPATAKDRT